MLINFVILFLKITLVASSLLPDNSTRLLLFRKCVEAKGFPVQTELIVTRTSNPSLYNNVNHQWNLRIPYIDPLAYFLPKTTADVQLGVICASKSDIPVIPKSGGHSYEAFSFGNSDTIVIDFFFMRKFVVDQEKGEARIEPGALLSEVYYKLWKYGRFGLPVGTCFQLGIGGFAIGGGEGYFSNLYGLAVDHILEFEMVDTNGFVHQVNAVKNRDLFWALRGVGSGFIGIVTNFKFKLYRADNLQIYMVKIHYDLKYSTDAFVSYQRWLNWTAANTPTIHSQINFSGKFRGEFAHVGTDIRVEIVDPRDKRIPGSQERKEKLMAKIHEIFPRNGDFTEQTYESYMDFVVKHGFAPVLINKTVEEIGLENIHRENSAQRWVKQKTYHVKKFSNRNVLEKMGEILENIPDLNVWVQIFPEGGAVRKVSPNAMSYVHRDSVYSALIRYEGSPDPKQVEVGWSWIEEFFQAVQPTDGGETYQNYVDLDLKDYLDRYYGANLPRLIRTKRAWDPTNYFQNPQSIPIL